MKNITYLFCAFLVAATAFAQDCPAVIPPYSFDSEIVSAAGLPECAVSVLGDERGIPWRQAENPDGGFTDNVMMYEGESSSIAADSWLFTRGVILTAGVNYRISFKYANSSIYYWENFTVTYGLSQEPSSAEVFFTMFGLSDAIVHTADIPTFTVATTGTYYFGLHAMSVVNQGNIYIDDFSVSEAATNSTADEAFTRLTVFPNPADNAVTINSKTMIDAVELYNLHGQRILRKEVLAENVELSTGNLAPGIYSVTVYNGNSTERVKLIKK